MLGWFAQVFDAVAYNVLYTLGRASFIKKFDIICIQHPAIGKYYNAFNIILGFEFFYCLFKSVALILAPLNI